MTCLRHFSSHSVSRDAALRGFFQPMSPNMSTCGDIGLVLSGGGAKGAFQAGVWKAMCELGLAERVQAISGTSVGALNAAAFASVRDPGTICRFWREHVEEVATPNLRHLTVDAIQDGIANTLAGKAFPFHGLLDRSALERIVRSLLPADWPTDGPQVIASSLECRGGLFEEFRSQAYRLRRFRIDEEPDLDRRIAMLLASAAIPWGFDPVEIDGRRFVDGGWDDNGGENVPIRPLRWNHPDIETIIVVRCNSAEVEPDPTRVRIPRGVGLVEIRPSSPLTGIFGELPDIIPAASSIGGIPVIGPIVEQMKALSRQIMAWSGTLAFDRSCAQRYIKQGYADALSILKTIHL